MTDSRYGPSSSRGVRHYAGGGEGLGCFFFFWGCPAATQPSKTKRPTEGSGTLATVTLSIRVMRLFKLVSSTRMRLIGPESASHPANWYPPAPDRSIEPRRDPEASKNETRAANGSLVNPTQRPAS